MVISGYMQPAREQRASKPLVGLIHIKTSPGSSESNTLSSSLPMSLECLISLSLATEVRKRAADKQVLEGAPSEAFPVGMPGRQHQSWSWECSSSWSGCAPPQSYCRLKRRRVLPAQNWGLPRCIVRGVPRLGWRISLPRWDFWGSLSAKQSGA